MGGIARGWPVRLAVLLGVALLWLGTAAWAWGSWSGFLANPARRGMVVAGS